MSSGTQPRRSSRHTSAGESASPATSPASSSGVSVTPSSRLRNTQSNRNLMQQRRNKIQLGDSLTAVVNLGESLSQSIGTSIGEHLGGQLANTIYQIDCNNRTASSTLSKRPQSGSAPEPKRIKKSTPTDILVESGDEEEHDEVNLNTPTNCPENRPAGAGAAEELEASRENEMKEGDDNMIDPENSTAEDLENIRPFEGGVIGEDDHCDDKADSEDVAPVFGIFPGPDSGDNWTLNVGNDIIDVSAEVAKCKNHKCAYDPVHFGIVRLGPGVRKPPGMSKPVWKAMKASYQFEVPKDTKEFKQILREYLLLKELKELKSFITRIVLNDERTEFFKESLHLINFFVFETNVLANASSDEADLSSLLMTPMMTLVVKGLDLQFVPGEKYSKASKAMKLARGNYDTEDAPLGQKVDGLILSTKFDVEVVRNEYSGGVHETDRTRYLKDHVRGYLEGRDRLDVLGRTDPFQRAPAKLLRKVKKIFCQTLGKILEGWVLNWATTRVYRMILFDRVVMPTDWNSRVRVVAFVDFFWKLRAHLRDACNVLEEILLDELLNRDNAENMPPLMRTHRVKSPQRPGTGKSARSVRPHRDDDGFSSD